MQVTSTHVTAEESRRDASVEEINGAICEPRLKSVPYAELDSRVVRSENRSATLQSDVSYYSSLRGSRPGFSRDAHAHNWAKLGVRARSD